MTVAVLGIDLGMSGARAAVIDGAGKLLGRGRARHPASGQVDDRIERDPMDWIGEVFAAARAALADAGRPRVEAIGIGALGPCPVLLDADLEPVGPAPLFSIDSRAQPQRRRLIDSLGLADDDVGQDHVVPRLLWMQENEPARFGRAVRVVDAAGFVVARLTGRAAIDPITARDHRLPDLESPVPLPEILPADRIAGGLVPDAAAQLGLSAGTPVTVGTYDSYVDIAGAGVATSGDACMLLGTTLILGRVTAERHAAAGLRATPHLGEGWFFGGWTSAAGTVLNWARDVFGEAAEAAARDLAPGAGGLVALPYLAGERAPIWDPFARGAALGLTLGTSKPELYRAMLDAVVLSGLDLATRLGEVAGLPDCWRAGGGGTRHPAWAQAMCDALGRPVEIVAHAGEAVPPALLALRALGRGAEPQIARTLLPDAGRHARYGRLYPIYRDLYPRLADAMHALGRFAEETAKEDS
ncbi:MAG: FGGY-family carbohydrate kinase [Dongiaceae bacterium]